jgi:hypothetical protein
MRHYTLIGREWEEVILVECGETRSNSDIVDLIEARIGMRITYKTVSERRAALGIDTRRTNNWTAPLRRWRPWST